jgi:hypothetical protein
MWAVSIIAQELMCERREFYDAPHRAGGQEWEEDILISPVPRVWTEAIEMNQGPLEGRLDLFELDATNKLKPVVVWRLVFPFFLPLASAYDIVAI